MRKFSVILTFFFLSSFCLPFLTSAQVFIRTNKNCDFLKHLKFKNGKDTVLIEGTYKVLIRDGEMSVLHELDRKGLLKYDDFGEIV